MSNPYKPWVSVDDKLPDLKVWVFVVVQDATGKEWADVGYRDENGIWLHEHPDCPVTLKVIHWAFIADWSL